MKTPVKILIVAAVAVAAVAAVALKQNKSSTESQTPAATPSAVAVAAVEPAAPAPAKLPKLLDLGADKCIPCKMMAPILAEFKRDYADQFVTEFIDVWKNPDAGKQCGIRAIPTQIFYDVDGKELFRHEGFYGREDMLNKWKELGVAIRSPSTAVD